MALFIYRLIVGTYGFAIQLAALANHKARQWRAGRKNWRNNLKKAVTALPEGKRVWFHCASYGEFEQGRPLMEAINKREPETQILLSFFSPSGYLPFKNWQGADLICYLPLDSPKNASDFLTILKPDTIFFIKYEYWLFFLKEISKRSIPAYLISATFKSHHPFFKWYGHIFRKSLLTFRILFLQDKASCDRLKAIGITNFILSGDTRIDRVLTIRSQAEAVDGFTTFKGQSRLLIAGSTWPRDEALLIDAFLLLKEKNLKLVIVPHNIHATLQKETGEKLKRKHINYCLHSDGINSNADVMVLDTMGLLSRVYRYADFAYVGGGFDHGIHNLLEPAVYGIPVSFGGTDYAKFNEAVELVNRRDAQVVQTAEELSQLITFWLSDQKILETIKEDLALYFSENSRVTERILEQVK